MEGGVEDRGGWRIGLGEQSIGDRKLGSRDRGILGNWGQGNYNSSLSLSITKKSLNK
ncbi:hypothetical protein OIDMADRAFT_50936 [Oidiodendron maius Zn]|uniref:Uncharacterized protein n=1 Tax=Oidiodendron maius (strain Zn) TaxID=913774 RepID=A0A0C3HSB8_OIDMZ|nr:hypothetical protein OIDMADRAFT_50936 [Oidiodendron maius Zn]